jgi:hypothetical protein
VDLSERVRRASEFVAVLVNGDRTGFLSVGQSAPERDELWFDLSRRGERAKAARTAALLGLGLRLGIFCDRSSSTPSNVLRSHVVVCRFKGLTKANLRKLDPRPDVAIAVGDLSYALWGQTTPLDCEQMGELQRELHHDLVGDDDWSASASSFIPVPGGVYDVDGEDVEAKEWRIGR